MLLKRCRLSSVIPAKLLIVIPKAKFYNLCFFFYLYNDTVTDIGSNIRLAKQAKRAPPNQYYYLHYTFRVIYNNKLDNLKL